MRQGAVKKTHIHCSGDPPTDCPGKVPQHICVRVPLDATVSPVPKYKKVWVEPGGVVCCQKRTVRTANENPDGSAFFVASQKFPSVAASPPPRVYKVLEHLQAALCFLGCSKGT